MRKYLPYVLFPCLLIFSILFIYQTNVFCKPLVYAELNDDSAQTNRTTTFIKRSLSICDIFLLRLNTSIPILLIDPNVLELLDNDNCSSPINTQTKIGVDVKYLSETWLLRDSKYDVLYFTNETKNDYLDFRSNPRKIIPKRFSTRWVGNTEIPLDTNRFLGFWRRAKFVKCLNLHIPRARGKVRMPAEQSVAVLARLRDELIEKDMFPFLNGGTLLGWYRECSVIPHTSDMDISVFAENYNPEFVDSIEKNSDSDFRIKRKFGMINDSFELTVAPRKGFKVFIDIFLMYEGFENGTLTHHWVGGVSPDGTKYKYSYPVYDPWCAANLHGHIFWVTCTPREKIVKEYGELWYQDHLTSKYSWSSSGKNVKKNGKWTKEQMKEVYKVF